MIEILYLVLPTHGLDTSVSHITVTVYRALRTFRHLD